MLAYAGVYLRVQVELKLKSLEDFCGNWLYDTARVQVLTLAYASIRQHTPAYVSIRQHTPAYVSIRQHTGYTIRHACRYSILLNLLALQVQRCKNWRTYGACVQKLNPPLTAAASEPRHALTYAHVCSRVLTCANVCSRAEAQPPARGSSVWAEPRPSRD